MRPQVGQLINNKYRLLRLIGDGGMGSVFEARHEVLATSVALKFLHPELSRRQGLVQRFLQEARVSARIQSPHVVRVTDVEQTSAGLAFIVMEYLRGTSLQTLYEDLYKEGKRLSYDEALNYALQMLDGLEAAHDEGIIHRDLKPDNVMITKGKRGEPLVKLLDFGIAKLKINGELYKGLTRPGVIMGTPEYMAPEQVFSADQVDVRADIFSCGVMFFEMFAGRRPVGGDEPHQIAAQYLAGSVARLTELAPHVPRELAAIVHRAMLPDPKDRFATVADFRAAMERFKTTGAGDRGVSTPPPAQVSATPHSDRSSERPSPDESRRSVPKTIPPSDDVHAEGANVDGGTTEKVSEPFGASSGADPLSSDRAIASAALLSKHNPQNGTSVMGAPAHEQTFDGPFGLDQHRGKNGSSFAGHAAIAKSSGGVTPPGVAVPPSRAGSAANLMESTLEGAPFFPGATEGYQALDHGVTPRPGGTNIAAGMVPGTASYDATAGQSAMHPNYASAPAHSPPVRPRKKGGIFGILFAATAVAVLAVGGVWAYDQYGRNDDNGKPHKPVPIPQPTQQQGQTSSPTETGEPATPQPQPTPQPTPTPTPTQKTNTPTQTPQPKPSASPTTPGLPPWVIPSSFQVPGLELPPAPWQPQPQPQPTGQPDPPKHRLPIPPLGKIFRPGSPVASTTPAPATSTPPSTTPPTTTPPTTPSSTSSTPATGDPTITPPKKRIPVHHLSGGRRAMR